MALTKVLTGGIALDAVDNTILKLDDDYALTGTISGAGKVLQAITGLDNTQTTTASTTYASTGLSVAITPSATNSRILILAQTSIYVSGAYLVVASIQRAIAGGATTNLASTANSGFVQQNAASSSGGTSPLLILDSPSTTAACTYTILFRNNSTSNTSYSSINAATDTMTCIEIGA